MDTEKMEQLKNSPLFYNKEIKIIPLGSDKIQERSTFLIECEGRKSVLKMDNQSHDVKKELKAWLTLAQDENVDYRPNIYYVSPDFKFSISEFYEGYTSIKKLKLTEVDQDILSKHLVRFLRIYQCITDEDIDLKKSIGKDIHTQFLLGIEKGLFKEEDKNIVLQFLEGVSFENVATYSHQRLEPENILYNPVTKDMKVIHMRHSKFSDPIYDAIYMSKTLPPEISRVFLPAIELYNPKIVQIISLLCDLKICLKREKQKEDFDLQEIYAQIEGMKEEVLGKKK